MIIKRFHDRKPIIPPKDDTINKIRKLIFNPDKIDNRKDQQIVQEHLSNNIDELYLKTL